MYEWGEVVKVAVGIGLLVIHVCLFIGKLCEVLESDVSIYWRHLGGGKSKGKGMECTDGGWCYRFPLEEGEGVPLSGL